MTKASTIHSTRKTVLIMHLLRRLVIISRPISYIPALGAFFAGLFFAGDGSVLALGTFLGAFFVTFPMGLIGYGLNDIADRESDAQNPRKGGLEGARVTQSESQRLLVAIVVTAAISLFVPIVTRHFGLVLPILLICAFAYTYSVKPIRLKSRPGWDSFSNGIWLVGIFLTGYWANAQAFPLPSLPINLFATIVLFGAALHALLAVVDYETDKAVGDRTISVVFGKRKTLLLCTLLFAACLALRHEGGLSVDAYDCYLAVVTVLTLSTVWRPASRYIRSVAAAIMLLLPIAVVVAR